MDAAPVDIVDRVRPVSLHGVTWHRHADAMLDELARLYVERDNALDELLTVLDQHPELEADEHFCLAMLALF